MKIEPLIAEKQRIKERETRKFMVLKFYPNIFTFLFPITRQQMIQFSLMKNETVVNFFDLFEKIPWNQDKRLKRVKLFLRPVGMLVVISSFQQTIFDKLLIQWHFFYLYFSMAQKFWLVP